MINLTKSEAKYIVHEILSSLLAHKKRDNSVGYTTQKTTTFVHFWKGVGGVGIKFDTVLLSS